MSLHSGRCIHGYSWDELLVDDYVIEQVELLAKEQEQPIIHNGMLIFEWSPGVEIEHIWDDEREVVLIIAQETPLMLEEHLDEQLVVEENLVEDLGDKEIQVYELGNENDDEGLILIPRDNIVSNDKKIVENNSGHEVDTETRHTQDDASNEVAAANIDNEPM